MGIDLTGLRALSFAKRAYKFDFRNTITLARQEIHFWKQEYEAVRNDFDFEYDDTIALGTFCEPLLRKLGAENVASIDASAFEGASIVHDFNLPVPGSLRETFDTFLDFGSIEHIFNVAQVIDNIVNLVKPGGKILLISNANGFPAHGLFQFSPEFFYSVFSRRNGFQDTSVFLVRPSDPKLWHLVRPPAKLKRRNEIPFEKQALVLVFSVKSSSVAQLSVMQSDYDDSWTQFDSGVQERWDSGRISKWKKLLHELINPYAYRRIAYLSQSFQVRRKYSADRILIDPDIVDPADFMKHISGSATSDVRQGKP